MRKHKIMYAAFLVLISCVLIRHAMNWHANPPRKLVPITIGQQATVFEELEKDLWKSPRHMIDFEDQKHKALQKMLIEGIEDGMRSDPIFQEEWLKER